MIGLQFQTSHREWNQEVREMGWIIKVYIPVYCEEPEVFSCKEDAEKEIESLTLMQPENIYQIEEAE